MFNIIPSDASGAARPVAVDRSQVGAVVGVMRLNEQSASERNLLASLTNRWLEAKVIAADPRNQAVLQFITDAGTVNAKVTLNSSTPAKIGDQIAIKLLLADESSQAESSLAEPIDPTDQHTRLSQLGSLLGQLVQGNSSESKLAGSTNHLLPGATAFTGQTDDASNHHATQIPQAVNLVAKLDQTSIFHTDQLAHELENVVDKSGLFYEAHLKEWVAGQRSLEQLRQEPQAANALLGHDGNQPPKLDTQALPKELVNLLREQLQVLEKRGFAGHVEVWQGQAARIEIQEQESGHAGDDPWRTHLTLHLPALGEVNAELVQMQGRLSIWLIADQNNTVLQLDRARPKLANYLADKGLQVAGIQVRQGQGVPLGSDHGT